MHVEVVFNTEWSLWGSSGISFPAFSTKSLSTVARPHRCLTNKLLGGGDSALGFLIQLPFPPGSFASVSSLFSSFLSAGVE